MGGWDVEGGGDVGVVVGMGVCIAYIQLRMILYSRLPMEDRPTIPRACFSLPPVQGRTDIALVPKEPDLQKISGFKEDLL